MYIPKEVITFILGFVSCFVVAYIYEQHIEKKEEEEDKKGDFDDEKLEKDKQNK